MKLWEFIAKKMIEQIPEIKYSTLYKSYFFVITLKKPLNPIDFMRHFNENLKGKAIKRNEFRNFRFGRMVEEQDHLRIIIWTNEKFETHFYRGLFNNLLRTVENLNEFKEQVRITGVLMDTLSLFIRKLDVKVSKLAS